MGANSSSGNLSHTVAILVLSAAVLYVAWRHGQTRQEMESLRALVDASVSLNELEDQVMPAIDTLEREAARLKREVLHIARQMTTSAHDSQTSVTDRESLEEADEAGGHDVNSAVEGWSFHDCDATSKPQPLQCVEAKPSAELSPELSLLMGMGSLLSGSRSVSATGIPVTRVFLGSTIDGKIRGPSVMEDVTEESELSDTPQTNSTLVDEPR